MCIYVHEYAYNSSSDCHRHIKAHTHTEKPIVRYSYAIFICFMLPLVFCSRHSPLHHSTPLCHVTYPSSLPYPVFINHSLQFFQHSLFCCCCFFILFLAFFGYPLLMFVGCLSVPFLVSFFVFLFCITGAPSFF